MVSSVENTFGIDIIPENDEQRLEALRRYKILDTPPEEAFNNLAQLVANYFDTPIALISLVDSDRVFFKGNVGMQGVKNVSRGKSLCSLGILSTDPTVIDKPLEDPCLLANPLVHGDFGLRFYAGAPITTPDGYNIGTVCIVDKKSRSFTQREKDQLARFAKVVMHQIEQRLVAMQQVDAHKSMAAQLEILVQERTKELQEANLQLRQKNSELEQFTHVSHHDLQEPIRKILLYSDMVMSDKQNVLSETSETRLQKVRDAASRMSTALQDVLNFSNLGFEHQYERVDLNVVVKSVLSDLELLIAEKGAEVSVGQLPSLLAIPLQMHQLFYNLVNNALKFSRSDVKPVVTITSRLVIDQTELEQSGVNSDRKYLQLTVEDNGIGFHQEYSEKIFGLFQRLQSKTAYSGTGIGLALVKKVIANHKGKIWAQSTPGEGSVFKVLLPVE